jgi:hypothetical protein
VTSTISVIRSVGHSFRRRQDLQSILTEGASKDGDPEPTGDGGLDPHQAARRA